MNISKAGVKWGVIAGVVTVIVYIGAYQINPEYYFNWTIFPIFLSAMFLASKQARNLFLSTHDLKEESYTFNLALQPPFVTYLIVSLFYFSMNFVMNNYIDNSLPNIQRELTIANHEKNIKQFSEEEYENRKILIEEDDYSVTLE